MNTLEPPPTGEKAQRGLEVDESPTTPGDGMALPGLRGLDHIGITVPNMEQATAFFVDVLGCENHPRQFGVWEAPLGWGLGCSAH